ncbi:MAG TPA: hypothetical protein VI111_00835 [Thermoleophilaceae bacterium]
MRSFARKGVVGLVMLVVSVGVAPAIAAAVVWAPDSTAVDFTLTTGTRAVFTVSGAVTITCDTHTARGATGVRDDRITIRAVNNTYTDSSIGSTTCPTDQRGVTATVRVTTSWVVVATRVTGGTVTVTDNAAVIRLDGGIFGGCSSQIQRSTAPFTYDNRGRLQTDPRNSINTRGSGGFCVFGTSATQQETILVSPAVQIR